jgi:hypothetical protein
VTGSIAAWVQGTTTLSRFSQLDGCSKSADFMKTARKYSFPENCWQIFIFIWIMTVVAWEGLQEMPVAL